MFRCTLCGECCRGDQKVWLNPSDLSRLAAYLGMIDESDGSSPDVQERLLQQRLIVVEPGQNGALRPRLRFQQGPAGQCCRFLVNDLDENGRLWGRCSLHYTSAKPLVCRLAPLARTIDLADSGEEWREVPPVIGCPGWPEGQEPSADGRSIPMPILEPDMRAELDGETKYFRLLESQKLGQLSRSGFIEIEVDVSKNKNS